MGWLCTTKKRAWHTDVIHHKNVEGGKRDEKLIKKQKDLKRTVT